jgi:glutamate-1-semialdehyde 2,1-aminomutase
MEYDVEPERSVLVAGTFNGNPLVTAAGTAVLRRLRGDPHLYTPMNAMGERFRTEINRFAQEEGYPATATGVGSIFSMHTVTGQINSVRDLHQGDRVVSAGLSLLYRKNGLHITPSHGFISAAHKDEDITQLIEIYKAAMEELRAQGVW